MTTSAQSTDGNESGALSFEAAFSELQERVARLEEGDLTLEATITEFREATTLSTRLQQMITDAQLRVRELAAAEEDGGTGES